MVLLFLAVGVVVIVGGILFLITADCFDEIKKGLILLVIGIVLLVIPAMVPANEEIINCQVITTSMDINGEKVVTDTPMKWTWKERTADNLSYTFLNTGTFDYKVEVAE